MQVPASTNRFRFDHWHLKDLPQAQVLWGDSQVTALISKNGFSPGMIKARLQFECDSEQNDAVEYWPLFTLTGDFIGVCGLHQQRPGTYELGYHLRPKYWHQGIATESARQVIQFAREQLHADHLIAGHQPANLASRHVIEKLGFSYIGDVMYPPTGIASRTYELKL
ncbi:GNAT family N-acetyltransferase [Lacticaseibacillus porcinae]|uniref:GNAT family N-acetyltransferase n=1 Tax=Lacticaseibacillus porcinae TaxID=1123687 RepID=UPI000F78A841|nr:GNAT family N-acetyltransferase [Lacticaseibacillus porcinae]